jgi:TonB family protein
METQARFVWHPADSALSIDAHPDVMDGIARDILDESNREGPEIGGLLLGSVDQTPDGTTIHIERFNRISCGHAAGPQFILDAGDRAGLLKAATAILEDSERDGSELSAVGIYRSHMRPGLQLEDSDLELIDLYFHDAFDLLLLIKPQNGREVTGQFYVRGKESAGILPAGIPKDMEPAGSSFPYRLDKARAFAPPTLRSRRLIADFIPDAVEPSHRDDVPAGSPDAPAAQEPEHERRGFNWNPDWKKWWPLPASLIVAGIMLWLLLASPDRHVLPAPAAAGKAEISRPLGLSASRAGQAWRVAWNPNATALRDARSVQLFIRDGDEQNRVELSPQDRASGTYTYDKTAGNDVTFRLEVTGSSGVISAESYHFVREVAPAASTVGSDAVAPKPEKTTTVKPKITQPRATHRVPPVIPASIRPRIKGSIPVDVQVKIDARGHVTSAVLPEKPRAGLEAYLAERAVEAAKQWRFAPAREAGKAVAGEQTIRFTFGK